MAKDPLSALREALSKGGRRHVYVHACMCVCILYISRGLQTQRLASPCCRENNSSLWAPDLCLGRGEICN